jgi:hypothetical protein
MKFNQRHLVPIKVLKSFQDLSQIAFSNQKSACRNSISNLTVSFQEVKFLTCNS